MFRVCVCVGEMDREKGVWWRSITKSKTKRKLVFGECRSLHVCVCACACAGVSTYMDSTLTCQLSDTADNYQEIFADFFFPASKTFQVSVSALTRLHALLSQAAQTV